MHLIYETAHNKTNMWYSHRLFGTNENMIKTAKNQICSLSNFRPHLVYVYNSVCYDNRTHLYTHTHTHTHLAYNIAYWIGCTNRKWMRDVHSNETGLYVFMCVKYEACENEKETYRNKYRAITRNTIIFWSIANSSASPKFYYHYDGPAQKLCTEFITLIWFLVQFIIGQTKHLDRNMMVLINIEGVSFTVRFCVIVTV